jgi:hypothetical protein
MDCTFPFGSFNPGRGHRTTRVYAWGKAIEAMRLFSSVPIAGVRVGLSIPIGRGGRPLMPWSHLFVIAAIVGGFVLILSAIFPPQ